MLNNPQFLSQLRYILLLTSVACALTAFQTIQYLATKGSTTSSISNSSQLPILASQEAEENMRPSTAPSTAPSESSAIKNSSAAATSGRWTVAETALLIDFVAEHCSLRSSRGSALKASEFNNAESVIGTKKASQCHYKWSQLVRTYKAISEWNKKSGGGWHDDYGVNVRTQAEKEVFEEFIKSPDNAPLKPFEKKPWPFYRRLVQIMPDNQPRGTNAFNPASSESELQLATQVLLNSVNAEEDGAEDQLDVMMPPPPSSEADITMSFASSESIAAPSVPSLVIPPALSHATPSVSSVASTSAHSTSDAGSIHSRKRKHLGDGLLGSVGSSSSKHSSKSRRAIAETHDPFILTSGLTSSINRLVDLLANNSSSEIIKRAVDMISSDDTPLTRTQVVSATVFLTNATDEAVQVAQGFTALANNPNTQGAQWDFLRQRLNL